MKQPSILVDKSFEFALVTSRACIMIRNSKKEYDLSRQLLRSSTSIIANLEEGLGGNSKKDFYYKLTLCNKEARESRVWIRLMDKLELFEDGIGKELLNRVDELLRLIGSSQKTMREKYGFKFK